MGETPVMPIWILRKLTVQNANGQCRFLYHVNIYAGNWSNMTKAKDNMYQFHRRENMGTHKDLSGQKFGRLTAISISRIENYKGGTKHRYYKCRCDCGKIIEVQSYSLTNGNTKSCGCFQREKCGDTFRKHGGMGTRLYNIWKGMKKRCNNSNEPCYKYYGGKGIKVCDEWQVNFIAFRDWALNNGYADNLTIDRIDSDKNYEPSNCRWVTQAENARLSRAS
jgi:hypothetical protein